MQIASVHGIALDSSLQLLFDSIVVVIVDKVFNSPDEFSPALVDVTVVDFSFQYTEEVLHGCVVVAVAFSRHGLSGQYGKI